jgi:hypothetical protein
LLFFHIFHIISHLSWLSSKFCISFHNFFCIFQIFLLFSPVFTKSFHYFLLYFP